ncbi:Hha/YmoA family nucleoid-associated regulatory protein [Serratia symbiotica]|uniref:Hha/YmoA family nucleoid-associated regulatory protein n=1 Tax=Serratia symbiotica TaxID=138074 RepID=UPI00132992EC|nr:Hha/YmoA family nucleoid-associated regulatory protein [Serratia symbiotica]QTP13376.1 transcriptional regulator [Serratia symbiotica]
MAEEKTKIEYVMQLRRCQKRETFDTVVASMKEKLSGAELFKFLSAVDHRMAELATGKYYDKVPKEVWRLVK